MMLVCVSISVGVQTILSWVIVVVEESWSLVDLYTGIRDASIDVPSISTRPFTFPEAFSEQPFSVLVGSKRSGPFCACSPSATLGEVAPFRTYIKYVVERPSHSETMRQHPARTIDEVVMEAQVS